LNAVDIITPLGVDEVLMVPTHRVVPEATSALSTAPAKKSKESKKESKHGKKEGKEAAKSKKSQKDTKSPSTMGSNYEVDNLLGLDWNTTSSNAVDTAVKSQSIKPSSSSSSSMSGLFWLPLYSDKHMDISYHVAVSSSHAVSLHLKTSNHSKDGFNVSAAIKLLPSHPCRQFIKSLKATYVQSICIFALV